MNSSYPAEIVILSREYLIHGIVLNIDNYRLNTVSNYFLNGVFIVLKGFILVHKAIFLVFGDVWDGKIKRNLGN